MSDNYVTSVYFDEFIVSFSLMGWLINNLGIKSRRISIQRYRFPVYILAALLEYAPRFVEALPEISRRLCKVYSPWLNLTLGQYIASEIYIVSNERTTEYRV